MKRNTKLWLWLLLLFVLSPNNIYCQDIHRCDYEKRARHKLLASNINFDVDYIEKLNSVEFIITITNLHPEVKMIDTYHDVTYQYSNFDEIPKELKITDFKDNNTVKFEFYSRDVICQINHLYTEYIKLPVYNKYYKDPLCEGIEECVLCKKWVENNLDYNDFKKEIRRYKENLKTEEKKEQEKVEKKSSKIIQFMEVIARSIVKYYIYILIGIIFLGSLLSFIIYKKQEFRF